MTSPPLDSTHGRTTSSVACHHRLWAAHTVKQHRAWHDIIAFGEHRRSNDVGRGMTSPPLDSTDNWQCRAWHDIAALGQHTRSNYVWRGMTSLPLYNTHGQTTSSVACHYRLRAAHIIKRRQERHAIIAHGRQKWLNDVKRDMPSPPLDSTHGR